MHRILRILLLSILLLLPWRPSDRFKAENMSRRIALEAEKDLRCAVFEDKGLDGSLKYGLHYEMLQSLSDHLHRPLDLAEISDSIPGLDSLRSGVYDLVMVCSKPDSLCYDQTLLLESPDGDHIFALSAKQPYLLRELALWLRNIQFEGGLEQMGKRYKVNYNPLKKALSGGRRRELSPYDDIIKTYSQQIGWDWRLVAALIYKESKFTINNNSSRGAVGLMQVKPATAARFGVTDLLDPEQNIKAGTLYLKRLMHRYYADIPDEGDARCFALAAYNAGVGRVADARKLCESLGGDPTKWADVREAIPLMRSGELPDSVAVLDHGHFKGAQTLDFVSGILELYEAFQAICPE